MVLRLGNVRVRVMLTGRINRQIIWPCLQADVDLGGAASFSVIALCWPCLTLHIGSSTIVTYQYYYLNARHRVHFLLSLVVLLPFYPDLMVLLSSI